MSTLPFQAKREARKAKQVFLLIVSFPWPLPVRMRQLTTTRRSCVSRKEQAGGGLLNRKTPGWEEWKQLGFLKEGKFQPMAAIKQAKLPPTAVANLALQGAAVVVGQAYMAEISKQLDGIQSEISVMQIEMKLEREANIEASYEMLKFYLAFYSEIAADPERRQAAHAEIEDIKRDAIAAWKFQVGAMQ